MRGRAEAVETDALARLDAGDAQGAKPDDARAQQRRGVQVVERGGQRVDEVVARDDVFGVAAVDVVAGVARVVAQILARVRAEEAGSVGPA